MDLSNGLAARSVLNIFVVLVSHQRQKHWVFTVEWSEVIVQGLLEVWVFIALLLHRRSILLEDIIQCHVVVIVGCVFVSLVLSLFRVIVLLLLLVYLLTIVSSCSSTLRLLLLCLSISEFLLLLLLPDVLWINVKEFDVLDSSVVVSNLSLQDHHLVTRQQIQIELVVCWGWSSS